MSSSKVVVENQSKELDHLTNGISISDNNLSRGSSSSATASSTPSSSSTDEEEQTSGQRKQRLLKIKTPAIKYILVTGGVISGVGKGIFSSSMGVILKAHGFQVTAIKIDPYINTDAGTFSPFEHGEVFVLDDGGEVDLDLGNYERFLDVRLGRDNNITTGKIFRQVISAERLGSYLGKTVQVVPHITNAVDRWVDEVAKKALETDPSTPLICIIELGGTVGEIETLFFMEAFRQMKMQLKKHDFMNCHVSLVLEQSEEQKTKPTQNSVKKLRDIAFPPDVVVCRSSKPLQDDVRRKIASFCVQDENQVISVHDVTNIYRVPMMVYEQGIYKLICKKLRLDKVEGLLRCHLTKFVTSDRREIDIPVPLQRWNKLADRCDEVELDLNEVRIALVGKYIEDGKSKDAYMSVEKALKHAAMACHKKLNILRVRAEDLIDGKEGRREKYDGAVKQLASSHGILVPGGFGRRGIEGKIEACRLARENKIPFLGICLGMQCAVVEFARNVLGVKRANSTEFRKDLKAAEQFIVEMPEHTGGEMGATMRLGKRTTVFLTRDSKLRWLYKQEPALEERHRHRYEVNPNLVPDLCAAGLRFVGMGADEKTERDVLVGDDLRRTDSSNKLIRLSSDSCCEKGSGTGSQDGLVETVERICAAGKVGEEDSIRMEIVELSGHPYFVGVQFHPEYLSKPLRASPPYMGLLLAATGELSKYMEAGPLMHQNMPASLRSWFDRKLSSAYPFTPDISTSGSMVDLANSHNGVSVPLKMINGHVK